MVVGMLEPTSPRRCSPARARFPASCMGVASDLDWNYGIPDPAEVPAPDWRTVRSTISLRLSESLHKQIRELAKREGVSINQLINTAVAEKLAALMTTEYLEERGRRASRKKFEQALARVRDRAPKKYDTADG